MGLFNPPGSQNLKPSNGLDLGLTPESNTDEAKQSKAGEVKTDMDEKFEDVRRLLRLKRHELPSDDFFERFVHDFGQRQRTEMLRSSSRRVLLDRLSTMWWEQGFGRWSYGAAATACLAAVAVLGWQLQDRQEAGAGSLTEVPSASGEVRADAQPASAVAAVEVSPTTATSDPVDDSAAVPDALAQATTIPPNEVRLTNFIVVPDPIEFTADSSFELVGNPRFLDPVPPGVDHQARPLFESTRLRAASSDGGGSYIPLSEQ